MREGRRGRAAEGDGRTRPGGMRPVPRGGDNSVGRGGRRRNGPVDAPRGGSLVRGAPAPLHGDRAGQGVGRGAGRGTGRSGQ
eukprot:5678483-Pleurochrysis_carterae.AAC.1